MRISFASAAHAGIATPNAAAHSVAAPIERFMLLSPCEVCPSPAQALCHCGNTPKERPWAPVLPHPLAAGRPLRRTPHARYTDRCPNFMHLEQGENAHASDQAPLLVHALHQVDRARRGPARQL